MFFMNFFMCFYRTLWLSLWMSYLITFTMRLLCIYIFWIICHRNLLFLLKTLLLMTINLLSFINFIWIMALDFMLDQLWLSFWRLSGRCHGVLIFLHLILGLSQHLTLSHLVLESNMHRRFHLCTPLAEILVLTLLGWAPNWRCIVLGNLPFVKWRFLDLLNDLNLLLSVLRFDLYVVSILHLLVIFYKIKLCIILFFF